MKKEIIRKEFLKLRIRQYSYSKCKTQIKELYGYIVSLRTLKRWQKRYSTQLTGRYIPKFKIEIKAQSTLY